MENREEDMEKYMFRDYCSHHLTTIKQNKQTKDIKRWRNTIGHLTETETPFGQTWSEKFTAKHYNLSMEKVWNFKMEDVQ